MPITACKKGAYPRVPANAQEVDGEYYFNIKWTDAKNGWIGKAMTGERLTHDYDNNVKLLT